MKRGNFVSFEGSEGCGKTTQIRLLREFLESRGTKVALTREPGGTAVGEKIRELLQFTPEARNMTAESELLLFAASRAQLVREVIATSLEEGSWVIADRFLDSTTVYQGIGRGLDLAALKQINRFAAGGIEPDWTVLLDLDARTGHERALKNRKDHQADRIEDQPIDFFERVRRGYLELAEQFSDRIEVFDASLTVEEIASAIQKSCEKRFDLT